MAIYANIPIDQGASFASVISVQGPDGLAFNLTGYTARGQIRKTYTSSTAVTFTVAVQSASEGTIRLSLTPTQTRAMKAGRYLFDVEIVEISTGAVVRVVEGQVEVNPRITQLN